MNKEDFLKEVELAFQIFEMTKHLDYSARHRVMTTLEQLYRDHEMQANKAQYAQGFGKIAAAKATL